MSHLQEFTAAPSSSMRSSEAAMAMGALSGSGSLGGIVLSEVGDWDAIREEQRKELDSELFAFGNENVRKVAELIAKGANVNARIEDGNTVLMTHIIAFGDIDTCRFLLENGANVNAKNKDCETALMIAADRGRTEICALLIEHNANVNARDLVIGTALDYARRSRQSKTIRFLEAVPVLQKVVEKKSFKPFLSSFNECLGMA